MKTETQQSDLSPFVVWIMAIATGLTVACNYYIQPLLHTISVEFGISVATAGGLVTVSQVGYALGLVLVVPLGDLFERRRLISVMTLMTAGSLLLMAFAPHFSFLFVGSLLTAVCSVSAQILVPFAATLASPSSRGKVIGTVMSGLLLGILLARTFAGVIADLGGWRLVYIVAAVLMLMATVVLYRVLPTYQQNAGLSYGRLLWSIFAIFKEEPVLIRRSILGGLSFAIFSILWTSMAFLLAGPAYNYSDSVIGLFGLAGAAGAFAATPVGRLADKGKTSLTTFWGLVILLLSWIPLALGETSIWAFLVGVLVLDLAAQVVHISNQSVIYSLRPDARNRITAGYMTSYFIGGAIGSLLSGLALTYAGWQGVVGAGAVIGLLGLVVWFIPGKRQA